MCSNTRQFANGVRASVPRWFATFVVLASTLVLAQGNKGLSEADIIRLHAAGLSDDTIIQQIQHDGVFFQTDANTTIRLKAAGISENVIKALFGGGNASARPSSNFEIFSQTKVLYEEKQYGKLADLLRAQLSSSPKDFRSRTILIMTLLKISDRADADAEYSKLRSFTDGDAKPYVRQVESVVSQLAKLEASKTKLVAALQDWRADEALQEITNMPLSDTQKDLLRVYILAYEGKFADAKATFGNISFPSYQQRQQATEILAHIDSTSDAFDRLMKIVDFHIYSDLDPSWCFIAPQWWNRLQDLHQLSLKEYLNAISQLLTISPLNSHVMDVAFHGQLLLGKYEELEQLGDKIINAKGDIKVPFYASDRFFNLVVDARQHRIFSEADQHAFRVRYTITWPQTIHENVETNGWTPDLVPFDLPFATISSISQHTGMNQGKGLASHSYALKFEPGGLAPQYALMAYLYCTEGEAAGKSATRSLGLYLQHVISRSDLKAHLEDPSKRSGAFGDALGAMALGMLTVTNARGLTTVDTGLISAQMAQDQQSHESQLLNWQYVSKTTLNVDSTDAFLTLEKTIGLAN